MTGGGPLVTYRGLTIHTRRHGSLRLRLRLILEQRNITRYGFAKYSGLSLNTIYRLTRPHGRFELIRWAEAAGAPEASGPVGIEQRVAA